MSKEKIITNGDRIRSMTDEELAAMASRMITCLWCPVNDCCGCEPDECTKAWLAWLRAPAESEGEK